MTTHLLVDRMPMQSSDCPFAITCECDEQMPAVCQLKLPAYQYDNGITFGGNRRTNCDCNDCPYLKEN